ncbi:High choriolytic enzyme 1 [Liparis tanakae]|uniref:Metalloendopeptidase n=1 Tax=Liparis tanakae TaxID=230148 RepID=A0A4Z2GGK0_9TELE|nr:High choriolytic enzyme 1 [Liparis tanakae]
MLSQSRSLLLVGLKRMQEKEEKDSNPRVMMAFSLDAGWGHRRSGLKHITAAAQTPVEVLRPEEENRTTSSCLEERGDHSSSLTQIPVGSLQQLRDRKLRGVFLCNVLCTGTSTTTQFHFVYKYIGNTVEDDEFSVSTLLEKANINVCYSHVGILLVSREPAAGVLLLGRDVAAIEEDTSRELSVSELLERANRDRNPDLDEPVLIQGDIAIKSEADRNADPCTANGCLWRKWTDGKVYIPYYIANQYSAREKSIITRGLESFSSASCIRFRPYQNGDNEWLSIESRDGCYSFVGRQGGAQTVSLARSGCLYHGTVQHELLHALGFNHEQTRSDRDSYIRVQWENILDGMAYNFNKIATLNQGTPYDYGSVMQYEKYGRRHTHVTSISMCSDMSDWEQDTLEAPCWLTLGKSNGLNTRYAFSKNNRPTMVPIPNSNVPFGQATQMSKNDIDRLNRLYKCCKNCSDLCPDLPDDITEHAGVSGDELAGSQGRHQIGRSGLGSPALPPHFQQLPGGLVEIRVPRGYGVQLGFGHTQLAAQLAPVPSQVLCDHLGGEVQLG